MDVKQYWEDRIVENQLIHFDDQTREWYDLVIYATGISKPNGFKINNIAIEGFLQVEPNMQLKD